MEVFITNNKDVVDCPKCTCDLTRVRLYSGHLHSTTETSDCVISRYENMQKHDCAICSNCYFITEQKRSKKSALKLLKIFLISIPIATVCILILYFIDTQSGIWNLGVILYSLFIFFVVLLEWYHLSILMSSKKKNNNKHLPYYDAYNLLRKYIREYGLFCEWFPQGTTSLLTESEYNKLELELKR